ncbi:hypothetical protein [Flavobacterium soli]|uniref:hypothetical protein n=1 Tax=Flavobacterium soli TaxID=344881 RepID=UPI0004073C91|nr:hypothetical protein [Flavobacterium soli]
MMLQYSCNHNDEFDIFSTNNNEDGEIRFTLDFTNAENVDLDLYVQTPNGSIIFYGNLADDGGIMETECLGKECLSASHESIFWTKATAPSGVYKYWIEYYGSEKSENVSADYALKVITNSQVTTTKTGRLKNGISPTWSFEFKNER